MRILGISVVLFMGGLFPSSPASAQATEHPHALVQRLGDPAYDVRELAAQELLRLGRGAVSALQEGLAHSDPEIRRRCRDLLPRARRSEQEIRFDTFLLTGQDRGGLRFPGWTRFRTLAGSDLLTRRLYLDLYRAAPSLLEALEKDPATVGAQFASRQEKLNARLSGTAVARDAAPLVLDLAAVLVAARCSRFEKRDFTIVYQVTGQFHRPEIREAFAREVVLRRLISPLLADLVTVPDLGSQIASVATMLGLSELIADVLRPDLRRRLRAHQSSVQNLDRMNSLVNEAQQLDMREEAAHELAPGLRRIATDVFAGEGDFRRCYLVAHLIRTLELHDIRRDLLEPAIVRFMLPDQEQTVSLSRLQQIHQVVTLLGMKEAQEHLLKPLTHRRIVATVREPYQFTHYSQAASLARSLQLQETLETVVKPGARRQIVAMLESSDETTGFNLALGLARTASLQDVIDDTLKPVARSLAVARLEKSLDVASLTQAYNLLQSVGARDAIDEVIAPALSKALSAAQTQPLAETSLQQALHLAQLLRMKEGIPLAFKAATARNVNVYHRSLAILFVANVGDREHITSLEALMTDTTLLGSMLLQGQWVQAQLGDVALAAAVALSGQSLADYGFPWFQTFGGIKLQGASPHCTGFGDEAGRQAARKKWKEWRAAQR